MTLALTTLALLLTTTAAVAAPLEAEEQAEERAEPDPAQWAAPILGPVVFTAPVQSPPIDAPATDAELAPEALELPPPTPAHRNHKPGSHRVGAIFIGLAVVAAAGTTAYVVSNPPQFRSQRMLSFGFGGYGRTDRRP